MCAQELLGPELAQLPCNHGNEAMDGPGQENEKVESGPPAKVLCTPYEKQLKKMPGDLQ